jgi:branched-chain amino acid transport system ATP-binding protein
MLAIGRALMAQPRLLLLDEPSLGLQPMLVQKTFETITHIRRRGRIDPSGGTECPILLGDQ